MVGVPYTGETFDSIKLEDSDDMLECIWVRIREEASGADTWVRDLFRTLTQKVAWEAACTQEHRLKKRGCITFGKRGRQHRKYFRMSFGNAEKK